MAKAYPKAFLDDVELAPALSRVEPTRGSPACRCRREQSQPLPGNSARSRSNNVSVRPGPHAMQKRRRRRERQLLRSSLEVVSRHILDWIAARAIWICDFHPLIHKGTGLFEIQ